ncbi:unnamed protein product [Boreogadus saida]
MADIATIAAVYLLWESEERHKRKRRRVWVHDILRIRPQLGHQLQALHISCGAPVYLSPIPGYWRFVPDDSHQLPGRASTVASIVSDGVTAIWDCLVEEFMAVPTTEDWRWRVYRRVIKVRPELAERCVKATCVLHNLLRRTNSSRLGRVTANNAGREAIRIRETFTSYFSAEGTLSWHDTIV